MDRDISPAEARWVSRLKRCLKNMPASLEISVHRDTICVHALGASSEYFDSWGHVDDVPELTFFRTKRVRPCGESL